MFLDPDQLQNVPSSEILHQATAGRLGIDQRFFSALLGRREETIAALVEWANRDREDDPVNLEMEIVGLIHALKAAEGMPFLLDAIRIAPDEIPDEVMEAIHVFGADAVEPLLELYEELGEAAGGEVSFLLASLETRDPRILDLLRERLDYDAADGAFLLGVYGDPTARLILETNLASLSANDQALKTELENALSQLSSEPAQREETPFRVSENYPEKADPPIEILPDDARVEFLSHPVASVRAEAAHSFFNKELDSVLSSKLLALASRTPTLRCVPALGNRWPMRQTALRWWKPCSQRCAMLRRRFRNEQAFLSVSLPKWIAMRSVPRSKKSTKIAKCAQRRLRQCGVRCIPRSAIGSLPIWMMRISRSGGARFGA